MNIFIEKPARSIAILASLFVACAVNAATATKPRARRALERSAHGTYRTARYARQTNSHASHPASKAKPHHYVGHHYRRRRYYHHRIRLPKAPSPDRISQIQTALARGGYYQGDPTGKWDSSTIAALQKFQMANNIDSTGKLDAPTLQKLGLGSDIAGVGAPKPVVPGGCCSKGDVAAAAAPLAAKPTDSVGPTPAAGHAQPAGGPVPENNQNSAGQAHGSNAPPAGNVAPAGNPSGGAPSNSAASPKPAGQH